MNRKHQVAYLALTKDFHKQLQRGRILIDLFGIGQGITQTIEEQVEIQLLNLH